MATTKRRRKTPRWQMTRRRDAALKRLKESEPLGGQIRNPFDRLRCTPQPILPPKVG